VFPVLAVSEEVPLVFVPAMHHVLDIEPSTGAQRSQAGTGYAR
jgi:hypothetical protein